MSLISWWSKSLSQHKVCWRHTGRSNLFSTWMRISFTRGPLLHGISYITQRILFLRLRKALHIYINFHAICLLKCCVQLARVVLFVQYDRPVARCTSVWRGRRSKLALPAFHNRSRAQVGHLSDLQPSATSVILPSICLFVCSLFNDAFLVTQTIQRLMRGW
jgi:hypothetical protein